MRPCLDLKIIFSLKGQCHEIFDLFLAKKILPRPPYEQAKMVLQTFSFLQRYSIAKFEYLVSA